MAIALIAVTFTLTTVMITNLALPIAATRTTSSPTVSNKLLADLNRGIRHYGTLYRASDRHFQIQHITTGLPELDALLGGGLPQSRIIEISGAESSGKTALALHCAKAITQQGGIAAYLDVEQALSPHYCHQLGIDPDRFLLCHPQHGEMAFEVAEKLVQSKVVDLIVIDSTAALISHQELNGSIEDMRNNDISLIMAQGLRRLNAIMNESQSQCTIIFISQCRNIIGVTWDDRKTSTGANALKFFSSIRLEVNWIDTLRNKDSYRLPWLKDDKPSGILSKVVCTKNKVGNVGKKCWIEIEFNRGVTVSKEPQW